MFRITLLLHHVSLFSLKYVIQRSSMVYHRYNRMYKIAKTKLLFAAIGLHTFQRLFDKETVDDLIVPRVWKWCFGRADSLCLPVVEAFGNILEKMRGKPAILMFHNVLPDIPASVMDKPGLNYLLREFRKLFKRGGRLLFYDAGVKLYPDNDIDDNITDVNVGTIIELLTMIDYIGKVYNIKCQSDDTDLAKTAHIMHTCYEKWLDLYGIATDSATKRKLDELQSYYLHWCDQNRLRSTIDMLLDDKYTLVLETNEGVHDIDELVQFSETIVS